MGGSDHVVTHLFTDIEGSTRLWEQEPQRMECALRRHDDLARATVSCYRGRLVKTTGDGMHAVFDDPIDAVEAALHFVASLASFDEPGLSLRARCGLHAGIATARDGDYYGGTVNRAARIMGAAHGGQVLLSEAVTALVRERLPAPAGLLGMGRVRLKDLASAELVYQLTHPGLADRFPPLRSLDQTPNNLPQQVNSFVGRHGAITELQGLIHRHRLVTLVGAGGIGKSRLALQLAAEVMDEFPDGVWLVELAPLPGPSIVAATVARVIGMGDSPDISFAAVGEFLRTRCVLLILDNCEHVLDACAQLADAVLRAAPHACLLATSREAIRVTGECRYEVAPLSFPAAGERELAAVRAYPAVAMLLDRAREQLPRFELSTLNLASIVTICRELDGVPLALELAAARIRSLPVDEIARRLPNRFRLLASGSRTASPRHKSLESLVAWSYQLLGEDERAMLARLSVFAGSFDLQAVEAVCGFGVLAGASLPELLGGLVEKSLATLVMQAGDAASAPSPAGARYRLLETIRAFARHRLAAAGDEAEALSRHAAYFLRLAVAADEEIRGPRKPHWCARLDTEHDNLRAAMAHVRGSGNNPDAALRFGVKLGAFWRFRGHATEGRAHLRAALEHPDAGRYPLSHAGALLQCGVLASFQGDSKEALALGRKALALYRSIGRPMEEASTLIMLGAAAQSSGVFDEATACHEEALAIAAKQNAPGLKLICFVNLGNVRLLAGDIDAARERLRQALEGVERSGESTAGIYAHEMLAQIDLREGATLAAQERLSTALALAQRMGDVMQRAKIALWLGRAAVALGDVTNGIAQLGEGLRQLHELGLKEETVLALDLAAEALQRLGDVEAAMQVRAAAAAARAAFSFHWAPLDRAVAEADAHAAMAVLGEAAASSAERRGRARSLADAVDYALERLAAAVTRAASATSAV
ncbi:MAG: adenylate/guanylate cyclase domain-containing protein [Burkholderiales bacterium]